jgi:hypothetical protein
MRTFIEAYCGGTLGDARLSAKKYLEAAAGIVELAHQMWTIGADPVAGIDWAALMVSMKPLGCLQPLPSPESQKQRLDASLMGLCRHLSFE